MRNDWSARKLGEVICLEYGKPLPKDQRCEQSGFPAYGANGIKTYSVEPYCNQPSIIVGRKGTAGAVNLVEGGFWPLDVTYYVTFDSSEHDLKFLYYLLSALDLPSLATGVKPGINRNVVYAIERSFPPLNEQKRIVSILDEAFAGIDAAIANTEKNLANARELFESYLNSVFDETAGDWVTETIGRLVQKGILDRPMDGNHGEIHPKKADFVSSGVPFIMASDLVEGRVNQSDCNFISREQSDSLRKGFARDGDVLLSHKGTIGRAAILETELDYVMLTPQVTYYRILKPEVLSRRFLFYAFHSPGFLREMKHIAGAGSTRAYIGITKQLELEISYPPREQQERYANAFDELSRESKRLEQLYKSKLSALKKLKQSLLQKAFSGELTENEPEKKIDKAAA